MEQRSWLCKWNSMVTSHRKEDICDAYLCGQYISLCRRGFSKEAGTKKKKRKTWDGTKSLFPNISTFQGKVLLGGTELQVFRKRHRFTYTHVHTHTHTHSDTATHSEQPDQTHPWSRHYHTCSQHARWRTATTKKTPIVLIYGFHVPNLLL